MSKYQTVVGRFECIDISRDLFNIPAKIDTGAFHSAVHVSHIEEFTKNSKPTLKFTLLDHPAYPASQSIETTKFMKTKVRSSNGQETERYKVEMKIKLGFVEFTTSFTLTDRSKNVFPVLIGREALRKRFLVDVSKSGVARVNLLKAARRIPSKQEAVEGVNT